MKQGKCLICDEVGEVEVIENPFSGKGVEICKKCRDKIGVNLDEQDKDRVV